MAALASIIGIPIAIYSLHLTRRAAENSANEATKAKDASELARSAAEKTRADLKLIAGLSSLERALTMMDDIKSLLRISAYPTVPEKISSLIQQLNDIRDPTAALAEEDRILIQGAVVTLRKIES